MSVVPRLGPADLFHPAVAAWFARAFGAPTAAQARAWPAISAGRHTLVAAPTGSGKTLAAFLAAIDALVRQGVEGALTDETQVLYVSPLKALSNDIQRNLQAPLIGIQEELRALGLPGADIRAWVRTGDSPSAERERMRRRPPHIVVTTPELLYILFGSESGRNMLKTTRTVIIDEIHALAPNKRGAHLALSLERLAGALPASVAADRPFGHAEADRDGRAISGRRRRRGNRGLRNHRRRPYQGPRSGSRGSALAARGGDVRRGLEPELRPARRIDRRSIAPLWCSSTQDGWLNALLDNYRRGSAMRTSPRITAAWPKSCGLTQKRG